MPGLLAQGVPCRECRPFLPVGASLLGSTIHLATSSVQFHVSQTLPATGIWPPPIPYQVPVWELCCQGMGWRLMAPPYTAQLVALCQWDWSALLGNHCKSVPASLFQE